MVLVVPDCCVSFTNGKVWLEKVESMINKDTFKMFKNDSNFRKG
jgi:hypothetical protein